MFTINPDRTVTVDLQPNGDGTRQVVLREPSLDELIQLRKWGREADVQCPVVPMPSEGASRADMQQYADDLRDREDKMYGDDAPYAMATLHVINLLGDQNVTRADLQGWTANPTNLKRLIEHFKAPLAGPD